MGDAVGVPLDGSHAPEHAQGTDARGDGLRGFPGGKIDVGGKAGKVIAQGNPEVIAGGAQRLGGAGRVPGSGEDRQQVLVGIGDILAGEALLPGVGAEQHQAILAVIEQACGNLRHILPDAGQEEGLARRVGNGRAAAFLLRRLDELGGRRRPGAAVGAVVGGLLQRHALFLKGVFKQGHHAQAVLVRGIECAEGADAQSIRGKVDDGVNLIAAAGEEAPRARALVAGFQSRHEGEERPLFQQPGLARGGIGGAVQGAADNCVGGGQGVDLGDPVAGGSINDVQFDLDAVGLQFLNGQIGPLNNLSGNGSIGTAARERQGNLRFRGGRRRRGALQARHLAGRKTECHDKQQGQEGRSLFHLGFLYKFEPVNRASSV